MLRNWDRNFSLAQKYYDAYGDSNIPQDFKTIDGVNHDENGFALGLWRNNIILIHKGKRPGIITDKQYDDLRKIEMIFGMQDYKWMMMYNLAENYFMEYGNLEMESDFRTFNGTDYDKNGYNLGRWLSNQKAAYKGQGNKKISFEKVKLLEKINMVWFSKNSKMKLLKRRFDENNYDNIKEILNSFLKSALANTSDLSEVSSEFMKVLKK